MWSPQQLCWSVTKRAGRLWRVRVERSISFCLCALTHVHRRHLNGGEPWRRSWETGETRGEDRQDVGGARSLYLRAVAAPVSAPACVSCPQRAEALECTAPVCCRSPPLASLSPRGLEPGQTRQRRTTRPRNFCFSSKINPLLITATLIFMVRVHSSSKGRFYLRSYVIEASV